MAPLRCELNTQEVDDDICEAFDKHPASEGHPITSNHFEHGQWWVTCNCGAAWSVVDAEGGPAVDGFDFEQVSDGDEDYHR